MLEKVNCLEAIRNNAMKLLAKYYSINDCDIGDDTMVRDFVNLYGCRDRKGLQDRSICRGPARSGHWR